MDGWNKIALPAPSDMSKSQHTKRTSTIFYINKDNICMSVREL